MRRADSLEQLTEMTTSFVKGYIAGVVLEIPVSELYAHQSLSHANLAFPKPVSKVFRGILLASGISLNETALDHRTHHIEQQKAPMGRIAALKHTVMAGHRRELSIHDMKDQVSFFGADYSQDPLLHEVDGQISFRNNSAPERISQHKVLRIAPPLATIALVASVARFKGREYPIYSALAGYMGFVTGLAFNSVRTSYIENRQGTVDGTINTSNLSNWTKKKIDRHQRHHNNPIDAKVGLSRSKKVVAAALEKAGLIRDIEAA